MPSTTNQFTQTTDWKQRLDEIMEMMRETSRQTDPQEMVAAYGRRMAKIWPTERRISLSRRELDSPWYRITRFSEWKEEINPWKQKERLPLLDRGLLGELLYAGEPRIIDDVKVADDDPSAEYLAGQRSLTAIPMLDHGEALNMVVVTRSQPAAFDREQLPEIVWTSILFGRSTHNLVLAEQVREAYEMVDRELQVVGDIQRSLLPAELPDLPTLKLAAHYETSQRAGGDYYDFFPLPDGRWGIFLADVSGHGTPAAVMMAVTHSIAHLYVEPDSHLYVEPDSQSPALCAPPSDMLSFVNRHLSGRYTGSIGAFVTAFYGIYDPASRELVYSSAGHNPPRIKHCAGGKISALEGARKFPLGMMDEVGYENATVQLTPGDQIVFYTDGITEATSPEGRQFEVARLDAVLAECRDDATEIIDAILGAVDRFTAGAAASDDRTIVVGKVV